jgi:CopG family nickel-responsive transcriptional regulator
MDLVRFGVAMERELLDQLDRIVEARASTRSEILRDLARAEVDRAQSGADADAVGTLTFVYDHHVRDLTERLNEAQHELGAHVRATLHVHLSADHCLEVVVLHGHGNELRAVANRILAFRGVKRGSLELISGIPHDHEHVGHVHASAPTRTKRRSARGRRA